MNMNNDELNRYPIYNSLNKPTRIMGCNREAFLFLTLISGALIFSAMTFYAIISGIALFSVGVPILRKLEEYDSQVFAIYIRHVKYKSFYPANSTPFRINR